MKKNHSVEFQALWQDNRFNRAPLISTILLRIMIAVMFVMFVIEKLFQASTTLLIGIAVVLVGMMMFSRWLKKQSIFMERTFIQNLRFRDVHAELQARNVLSMKDICCPATYIFRILRYLRIPYGRDIH